MGGAGGGSGDGAQRERRAGGWLPAALALPLPLSPAHTRAHAGRHTHSHTRTRTPAGPGRPGAGHRGGKPASRTRPSSEPAPTSAPLRSAAARLARRPHQSCRKMVNDRWKTVGGASQLEDRPRDKPQVRAARIVGTWGGGRGSGLSGLRAGHPGWSLGRTPVRLDRPGLGRAPSSPPPP